MIEHMSSWTSFASRSSKGRRAGFIVRLPTVSCESAFKVVTSSLPMARLRGQTRCEMKDRNAVVEVGVDSDSSQRLVAACL